MASSARKEEALGCKDGYGGRLFFALLRYHSLFPIAERQASSEPVRMELSVSEWTTPLRRDPRLQSYRGIDPI